ncbi:spermine oxidase-like [Leptopilina boulardi]|uniref:spermine oxidase-like n=1 Tax=Leptopilina boulardi TaxID=63433 RepID=UPI0021F5D2DB|nr:spermine oxidase-like [Leptopilina boulardi]
METMIKESKISCENSKNPSVIIIGAGAAGIAAAAKLYENNFKNIKILEAENRIGGRIHTIEFGNQMLELGAHWIVGEQGNIIHEMAMEYELYEEGLGMTDELDEKIFDSSGNLIIFNELEYEKLSVISDHEGNFEHYAKNNKTASVGDFYNDKIEKFLEAHPKWKSYKKGITNILDLIMMGLYSADSWNDASVISYIEYEKCPGTYVFHWKKRGYQSIIDIIMKRYPKPEEELPIINNIILNTKVSLIDYSNEKIIIKTTNNEIFTADHVIVTCSLGVLKNQQQLFKPSLSKLKQKAIEQMGYGNIGKIYLFYNDPWWPLETNGIGFSFLWKDNDLESFDKNDKKNWLQGLIGFYTFSSKPNILAGLVTGKYSRDMEKLTDEEVKTHCLEILQKFLGKTYNVTCPTSIIKSKWYTNENFHGTFSFLKINSDHKIANPAKLSEPVIKDEKPIILFAGEATSTNHLATVHGAIETGWREAQRIIQHYS